MSRFVFTHVLLALPLLLGGAEEPIKPVTVLVLTPDGKPAAGATVWVYLDTNDAAKR
jgi:hypothetical protein